MDLVINYLNHNSSTVISFLLSFAGFVFGIILLLWFYNKRKFNALKHQIPADVVKNYLDSIIQNSTSLKSSLFRGGGLDISEGIPAVMPVRQMSGGESLAVGSADHSAELHQRSAEIATLRTQINEKKTQMMELEGQCSDCNGKLTSASNKIKELEAQLAKGGGGGGGADPAALAQITKERDELKEKLEEYSIIEDDLANLKRLKQENEQLRKSLGAGGAPIAAAPVESAPAPSAPAVVASAPEPMPELGAGDESLDEMAQALAQSQDSATDAATAADSSAGSEVAASSSGQDEKTPEDLLSEFEKMLG